MSHPKDQDDARNRSYFPVTETLEDRIAFWAFVALTGASFLILGAILIGLL